jgi:hypothetical protein
MLVQKPGMGAAMSDEFEDFGGADNAKAEIRAAVRHPLKGTTGRARDVIALEVMEDPAPGRDRPANFASRMIPWTMICRAANRRIAPARL